jgi:hypothetical protein
MRLRREPPPTTTERRRVRSLQFEPLEGRALLSTVSPTVQTRHHLVESLITARRALHVNILTERRERVEARHQAIENGLVPLPPPTPRGLWSKGSFAYNTYSSATSMARSSPVIRAGVDYAKRVVAPDTRKVASAYLGAIVHGNGKEINQISRTDAAKTVKQEFINLGNSSNVKKIGNAFTKFGNGVAKQFNRVFGSSKSTPPPKPAKAKVTG